MTLLKPLAIEVSTFYAYTGCDTVSAFATRGKSQLGTHGWHMKTFLALSTAPDDINEKYIVVLERYYCMIVQMVW